MLSSTVMARCSSPRRLLDGNGAVHSSFCTKPPPEDADVICSGAWKFWPLELMACINFDRECFCGVLNLLRYSNVFE
ncbi:hypothetical protein HN51_041374, partial [Arachis hypogaea]